MSDAMYSLMLLFGVVMALIGVCGLLKMRRESMGDMTSSALIFICTVCIFAGGASVCTANRVEETTVSTRRVALVGDTYQVTTDRGVYATNARTPIESDDYALRIRTFRGVFGQVLGEEAILLIPVDAKILYEE